MDIKSLQQHWEEFGKTDPLWAILTDETKKNGGWNLQEFFQTGIDEIIHILHQHNTNQLPPIHYGKALDFGCGIGRLSQALCQHFQQVVGIDIAPTMIQLANQFNQYPNQCTYLLNDVDNLAILPDNDFDFIYTNIVLQHMNREYSQKYLREFARILRPGGILIFQIPSHIKQGPSTQAQTGTWQPIPPIHQPIPQFRAAPEDTSVNHTTEHKEDGTPVMEMYGTPSKDIIQLLDQLDLQTVYCIRNDASGDAWVSYTYHAYKPATPNASHAPNTHTILQVLQQQYPHVRQRALMIGMGLWQRFLRPWCKQFNEVVATTPMPYAAHILQQDDQAPNALVMYLPYLEARLHIPPQRFDIIWSYTILQHHAPQLAQNIMQAAVQALVPGGIVIFQAPGVFEASETIPDIILKRDDIIEYMHQLGATHIVIPEHDSDKMFRYWFQKTQTN